MDRSTLTRNVRPLVKDGLLAMGREGWHRSRTVAITERGRARVCEALPPDGTRIPESIRSLEAAAAQFHVGARAAHINLEEGKAFCFMPGSNEEAIW